MKTISFALTHKLLLIGLALWLAAVACSNWNGSPTPAIDRAAEEQAVYDVVFQEQTFLVLHPDSGALIDLADQPELTGLKDQTFDDFAAANQQSSPVESFYTPQMEHELLSDAPLDEIMASGGWDAFYEKYPAATGIFEITRAGFNANYTQALVHVGSQSYYLAGHGEYIVLEKENGAWVIRERTMTWISQHLPPQLPFCIARSSQDCEKFH